MNRSTNTQNETGTLFFKASLLILIIGMAIPCRGWSQSNPSSEKPIKVMLLGTAHLNNPGRDAINPKVPDVLTDQKQKELQVLRDSIAKFRPNKIALEVQQKYQAAFDSVYQEFKSGDVDTFSVGEFMSRRSEQYQIGFKLARAQNIDHVYAVDHYLPMKLGEVMEYAKQHDPEFVQYFKQYKNSHQVKKTDSLLQNSSLISVYRYMNCAESVDGYREPYVRTAAVGSDTTFVGADVVADYHRRNLRIYANLMRIAEPGDRIFMMFGGGHQPFLRPLLKNSPRVEFVDPMEYL